MDVLFSAMISRIHGPPGSDYGSKLQVAARKETIFFVTLGIVGNTVNKKLAP